MEREGGERASGDSEPVGDRWTEGLKGDGARLGSWGCGWRGVGRQKMKADCREYIGDTHLSGEKPYCPSDLNSEKNPKKTQYCHYIHYAFFIESFTHFFQLFPFCPFLIS